MQRLRVHIPDGSETLAPASGAIFPSVPSPFIEVDSFTVKNLRKQEGGDWHDCLCDIEVEGAVECSVCDCIPGDRGAIRKGIFTFNNSGKEDAEFEIKVLKGASGDPAKPFPFKGRFKTEIKGISIIEGNNTFQFTVESPIYDVEGFTLWAVSFGFPDDPSYFTDPENEDLVTEPSVSKDPLCACPPGRGEFYPFYLEAPEALTRDELLFGNKVFKATPQAFSGGMPLLTIGESAAAFVLRPSCKTLEKDIPLSVVSEAVAQSPKELEFASGFLLGELATGAELICLADSTVIPLEASDDAFVYQPNLLADPAGLTPTFSIWDTGVTEMQDDSIVSIYAKLWAISKDPDVSKDLTSAMILWDLSQVGIDTPASGDWRSMILDSLSNFLSKFFTEFSGSPDPEIGYILGRYVGEALRRNLDPSHPVQRQDDGLLRFYADLLDDPFFSDAGYGNCARELLESCAGAIRDARRWAGRDED